jgi:calcineurin-like phosphoesterase family protein
LSQVWFTSDYHLGHRNIIGLCDRPFVDVEEMEKEIIERHNAVVGPDDEVYDLGDFAYRCSAEHAAECMRRLNGRRIMLWGNHDKPLRHAYDRRLLDDLVEAGKLTFRGDPDPRLQTGLQVAIENQRIILAHYAQRTWQGAFRGAWHLYGHSHGNLPPFRKSIDVGVDAWDFRPASFEELQARMNAVTEEFSEG